MSTPPTARFEDEDGNPTLGPNVADGNQAFQPENGKPLIKQISLP